MCLFILLFKLQILSNQITQYVCVIINRQSYPSQKSLTFAQWSHVMLSAITSESFCCFMTRATIIAGIRMTNITQGGACKEKKRKKEKKDIAIIAAL